MDPDDLLTIVILQRRYLNLIAAGQVAYTSGHKSEVEMLIPMADAVKKEIDRRFKKIPKKDIKRVSKSDLTGC